MAIANREMISPQTLWGGPQDALTVRDAGWLQIYVEDNQEILDMMIQAFRIAEDKRVLLPINICYDGFYLSHMAEKVVIPDQEDVDAFLPPYRPGHILLDPEKPMAVDPLTNGYLLSEYRYKHMQGQQNALTVIEETDREFAERFGRSHGGLVEAYRCDDCDAIMVTMGSMTGAAREAVDAARGDGKKIGLVKIRTVRPFPKNKIFELLKNVKAFGVVDRNVSFGWNTGIIYQEIRASLYQNNIVIPSVPFIGGLGGEDLTMEHFLFAIDRIYDAAASGDYEPATQWLNKEV